MSPHENRACHGWRRSNGILYVCCWATYTYVQYVNSSGILDFMRRIKLFLWMYCFHAVLRAVVCIDTTFVFLFGMWRLTLFFTKQKIPFDGWVPHSAMINLSAIFTAMASIALKDHLRSIFKDSLRHVYQVHCLKRSCREHL